MNQLTIEYVLDGLHKKPFEYVSIAIVLPKLLNMGDIIDKMLEQSNIKSKSSKYKLFRDGLYFKENPLLSGEELGISLGLYIDAFEVCDKKTKLLLFIGCMQICLSNTDTGQPYLSCSTEQ